MTPLTFLLLGILMVALIIGGAAVYDDWRLAKK